MTASSDIDSRRLLKMSYYQALKEHSRETVLWHMYGLSKIYEHRGVPNLDIQLERTLLLQCLSLLVSQ